MNLIAAAGLGVGLGAATGIPLGVVNVSVVEAATRTGVRHATAIGIGGALADATHATLAFVGVAPRLQEHRDLLRVLAAVSAAAVIAYAIVVLRGRTATTHRKPAGDRPGVAGGILVGVGLTLFNPAPLVAWLAVASGLLPGVSTSAAIAAALGVGLGSAAWFAVLARVAARGGSSPIVTRWLPRLVAVVLAAIAITAIVRVFR